MENNLISKKELLDLTGISYGQLYRWKRKRLIPEEWFIKKPSFTGQETFFPKDDILKRIDKIINMKDDLSLDDIAEKVSPGPVSLNLNKNELVERGIVSASSIEYYIKHQFNTDVFNFEKILFIYILDKMFQSGLLNIDEGAIVLQVLEDNYRKFDEKNCDVVFMRKLGISSCLLIQVPGLYFFESNTKLILKINIGSCIEELKIKLS